ncbi:MAG: sodium:solute symporter [FCB group bacterium]|nr:sodium:solute symporter [FCB group bacterium]
MHWIDLTIVLVFLAGLTVFGLSQRRFNRTTSDYFLGGRSLPWWAAMFSIVATETSVLTFISVPGLAYRQDWFFLELALGYILGRILVAKILLPAYFEQDITSIYEVIGRKFGPGLQKTSSGIFLVTRLLADGIRFLATAVIVQVVTGWSLPVSVLVIGVVTAGYTLLGGLRTVIWVDSFQFVLYLGGGVIAIIFILTHLDITTGAAFRALIDQHKLNVFRFQGNPFTEPYMVLSAVIGGTILSFASHGVDYMMVQRALSTRDLREARKAIVGSGLFVFLQFVVFLLVGSLIYIYYHGIDLPKDREFPLFIVQSLPVGIRGLLLAGILSAAMSTLSSSINSLSSSTVVDWFKSRTSLRGSRWIGLMWAGVLIVIALGFNENDSAIIVVGLKIASFTYGGLLALFLISRMKRDFHTITISIGLLGGLAIVFLLQFMGLAWTWFVGLSTVTTVALTFIGEGFYAVFDRRR